MTAVSLLANFRIYLLDTQLPYRYSNDLLNLALQDATQTIFGSAYTTETLPTGNQFQVFLYAKIVLFENLTTKVIDNFSYSEGVTGDKVDKSKIAESYIKYIAELRKQYDNTYEPLTTYAYNSIGQLFSIIEDTETEEE